LFAQTIALPAGQVGPFRQVAPFAPPPPPQQICPLAQLAVPVHATVGTPASTGGGAAASDDTVAHAPLGGWKHKPGESVVSQHDTKPARQVEHSRSVEQDAGHVGVLPELPFWAPPLLALCALPLELLLLLLPMSLPPEGVLLPELLPPLSPLATPRELELPSSPPLPAGSPPSSQAGLLIPPQAPKVPAPMTHAVPTQARAVLIEFPGDACGFGGRSIEGPIGCSGRMSGPAPGCR
jgi:hypothetical protein